MSATGRGTYFLKQTFDTIVQISDVQHYCNSINFQKKQASEHLIIVFAGGNKVLEYAYETVELTISSVKNYVDEWLRYQALWDLQV